VRSTWESEETQRRLQEMRSGLESMVREVGQAIDESAKSPTGQKVQQDASRAAEAVRTATEQTVQEVRPQLINALQQLNNELQKLVTRIQDRPAPSSRQDDDDVVI
jgi:gas vesicle protein